jgi:hypothetical protein
MAVTIRGGSVVLVQKFQSPLSRACICRVYLNLYVLSRSFPTGKGDASGYLLRGVGYRKSSPF